MGAQPVQCCLQALHRDRGADQAIGLRRTLRERAPHHPKAVLDTVREAVSHGAVLLACTDALQAQGIARSQLIPECRGHGGAVQFMARVAALRWRSLVF